MTDQNSNSLFQGKYLGSTQVDGRCNKALLSWIIEEFLLTDVDYKSIWFNPGESKISFVEDDGAELMSHAYADIAHFIILKDGKCFAYLVRSAETKKFNFFAFQALQQDDVSFMKHTPL